MAIEVWMIAGPTASGKSKFALDLARAIGGAIINCDSMQVYSDLRVLSARPSEQDMALAPHFLYGHMDGGEAYSVGHYLENVENILKKVRIYGLKPIFVGGTGLYFKTLLYGLSHIPAIPEEVRSQFRSGAEHKSAYELHQQLLALDPIMAQRLRPSDRQRIVRAIEVCLATGKSLAVFQQQVSPPLLDPTKVQGIFFAPPRSIVYEAIDQRLDRMVETGAMTEVEHLWCRNLDTRLPIMRALGVPGFISAIKKEISFAAALVQAKAQTKAYAKRQFTFARHQLPIFHWVENLDAAYSLCVNT